MPHKRPPGVFEESRQLPVRGPLPQYRLSRCLLCGAEAIVTGGERCPACGAGDQADIGALFDPRGSHG